MVATSATDPLSSPIAEAMAYATTALYAQPQFGQGSSSDPMCDQYFLAPTPCDVLNGESRRIAPSGFGLAPGNHEVSVVEDGSGGAAAQAAFKVCGMYAPRNFAYRFGVPEDGTYSASSSGLGAAASRGVGVEDLVTGSIHYLARAASTALSGARLDWQNYVGFGVRFPAQSSFNISMNVEASWILVGQRTAGVGSGYPLAGGQATPASTIHQLFARLANDGTIQAITHGGQIGSFGTNGVSISSGPGWAGLNGVNPYEASKQVTGPKALWNNQSIKTNQLYFWGGNSKTTVDVGSSAGGATAQVDFQSGAAPSLWRVQIPAIEFEIVSSHSFADPSACDYTQ